MDDADATRSRPPELSASLVGDDPELAVGAEIVDEPETYRVEGKIGSGGMGQVLAAHGNRLGRSVAVKLVTADREELQRRFEREARVTARLQHPGIVPIYGMGRRANGRPFYAMKHVTGRPLDALIDEADTAAKRLALLPNVLAVAEAIAYAHEQGVIHRDLKPANILVGAFGETVVIDWGLAKDTADTDEPVAAGPYRNADETAYGRVMGTPAYMPPEQARGERVDRRADVYALGAILYHVLSGVRAHARERGESVPWETMVARVIAEQPEPLDRRQPGLPTDLLAIVARAMRRSPDERFATAGALADDLRRFQTGQLVGAHRYSTRELVKRWLRRHRTAVAVGAVSVVLLASLGTVSVVRIIDEQARAEAARDVAELERDQAESLTNFMLFELKAKLASAGRLDLMDTVVKQAQTYYDEQPPPVTDKQINTRAAVLMDLGEVLAASGKSTEALEKFRAAADLMQMLAIRSPTFQLARHNLASSLRSIGNVLYTQHDFAGSKREYTRALEVSTALAKEWPDDLNEVEPLGSAHSGMAAALDALGDAAGAMEHARAQLAIAKRLRAAKPDDKGYFTVELEALQRVAGIAQAHDPEAALADQREALELALAASRAFPNDAIALQNLSDAYLRVAYVEAALDRPGEELDGFRAALPIVEKLQAQDPTNADRRKHLMDVHSHVGDALRAIGKPVDALAEYRTAQTEIEALVELDPRNVDWLGARVVNAENLGQALAETADRKAAIVEFRRALALTDKLVAAEPANPQWKLFRAVLHGNVGDQLAALHDGAGAFAEDEAGLPDREALVALDRTNIDYAIGLAAAQDSAARAATDLGRYDRALALATAAVDIARKLVADHPGDPATDWVLVAHLVRAVAVHARRGEGPAAVSAGDEAVAIAKKLAAATHDGSHERELLYVAQEADGDALITAGRRDEAQRAHETAVALAETIAREQPQRTDIAPDIKYIRGQLAELHAH